MYIVDTKNIVVSKNNIYVYIMCKTIYPMCKNKTTSNKKCETQSIVYLLLILYEQNSDPIGILICFELVCFVIDFGHLQCVSHQEFSWWERP